MLQTYIHWQWILLPNIVSEIWASGAQEYPTGEQTACFSETPHQDRPCLSTPWLASGWIWLSSLCSSWGWPAGGEEEAAPSAKRFIQWGGGQKGCLEDGWCDRGKSNKTRDGTIFIESRVLPGQICVQVQPGWKGVPIPWQPKYLWW